VESLIEFCQSAWVILLILGMVFIGRYYREVTRG